MDLYNHGVVYVWSCIIGTLYICAVVYRWSGRVVYLCSWKVMEMYICIVVELWSYICVDV